MQGEVSMPVDITAQQVVGRITENLGATWKDSITDVFQAGSPDTRVTGIATTFTPTMEVLRRAVSSGKNMVISREPAFYREPRPPSFSGSGQPASEAAFAKDQTVNYKKDFVAKNNLVLWRFYDNWNARNVDGQLAGLAKALGWEKYHQPSGKPGEEPYSRGDIFFSLPETSLIDMATAIQKRLKDQGIRIIGDRQTKVRKVAVTHGFFRVPNLQQILREPGVDAVLIGEPVEWEASPYFEDIVASGQKRGMVILGHQVSEEPGSGEVALWLKTFIPEAPVEWIPAGEPFWVPR
jgi:putative NIF3 family GTP cyclohydrolase 1 type 2